jgi:hypothetical protein
MVRVAFTLLVKCLTVAFEDEFDIHHFGKLVVGLQGLVWENRHVVG